MTSVNPAHTPAPAVEPDEDAEERLPTFSEQVAEQLGGVRGMVESSIPVAVFVLANIVWSLKPAIIVAVVLALAIAGYRLRRRESVRHALNGLLGIGIGAVIALQTGKPEDFYLPGIFYTIGYAVAMIASVGVRRPLVGWLWAIVADHGATRWRDDRGLRRTFNWLTLLWSAVYVIKVAVNLAVYFNAGLSHDQKASILGVMRIALGFPPYAMLLALTVWAVRRYLRAHSTLGDPVAA